jgi:hypothetical protein
MTHSPATSAEFASAEVGDEKLPQRLVRIADCVAAVPGAGFPEITRSDGDGRACG